MGQNTPGMGNGPMMGMGGPAPGGNPLTNLSSGFSGGTNMPMGGTMQTAGLGGQGANPYAAQEQQYMQYMAQAMPSINAGLAAGTIKPGQAIPNLQTPQSFGIPAAAMGGGFGNAGSSPMMGMGGGMGAGAGGMK